MIDEKIEENRTQLTQRYQQTLGEITQAEQRLNTLRNNLQQIIGAISFADLVHPPEDPAPSNGQVPEEELEGVAA